MTQTMSILFLIIMPLIKYHQTDERTSHR